MPYNYNELQKYYNTRNYQGAIDYLNSFEFEGRDAITVRNEISKLQRNKAIEESIKQKLVGEDSEAYNFINGLKSGYVDRTMTGHYDNADKTEYKTSNRYGDEYLNYINNLKTNDGKLVNSIAIDIDDEDALKRLGAQLNIQDFAKNDLGIKLSPVSGGKYRVLVDTENTNLYKVFNAVDKLNAIDLRKAAFWGAGIGGTLGGILGAVTAIPTLGMGTVTTTSLGAGLGTLTSTGIAALFNDYDIKAVANGKVYDSSDFNLGNLKDAVNLVNNTEKKYNEINDKFINIDTNVPSEISVSGYMSLGHARAAKYLANGTIDETTYNNVVKMWDDYMTNIVNGASFADKKVYVWGNKNGDTDNGKIKTGIMLRQTHNTDSENAKNEILLAMKDKRCTYQMATKDGQIGTMFTIKADVEKGNISDDYGERRMQIFVEGLYSGDAEEYYESDTKTKAARTNADMKKIGYAMTLSNNEKVGYENGIPYKEQYNKDTDSFDRIPISESDILQSLNESAIIDQTIDYILKNYNKTTGKVEQEDEYGNPQDYSLQELLQQLAKNAVDENYPKGEYSRRERDLKEIQMYGNLLNNLPKSILNGLARR